MQVEVAKGYLLPSRTVVDSDLELVFGIALYGGHLRSLEARGRCQKKTGRAVYSAYCARVSCVEAAGQGVAQGFWSIVGCEKVVRIWTDPELLVDTRRGSDRTVELFVARKGVIV